MSTSANIKAQIKTVLDTLVPASLKNVVITDIRKDPLDQEIGSYPTAFIMPPAMATSDRLDNRNVIRDLTFVVQVYMRGEDTTTPEIEDLMETICNALDNSITLAGTSVGGIVPITSQPEAYQHNGRDLIVFDVIIKARAVQELSF